MTGISRIAGLALVLGLAQANAIAADLERLEKPAAQVGTSWRMRITDGMTRNLVSEADYRISAVNDREVEVSDAAGAVVLVLDAADYALKRAGDRIFEPAVLRLRYPVAVGDRWESAYSYVNPQCGPTKSQLSFKAVGWEEITLPTGKQRALRVDSSGSWRNSCGSDRQSHKHWYLPSLGVPVRQEDIVYFQGRIFQFEVQELQPLTPP